MASSLSLGAGGSSRQIESIITRLANRYPAAIVRALNRAGTSTRAVMARGISQDLGLKVGTVRDQLKIEKATQGRPVVRISVTGRRIPLIDFVRSRNYPSRGRGAGVRARIGGVTQVYPRTFIAQMGSGHWGVFERSYGKYMATRGPRGGRREAIHEKFGPSLPRVFEKVTPAGLAAGEASLVTNLRHELRFALGGASTTP